jgi:cytochrome c-type biogenesis protein CcmH/NrfG
VGLVGTILTLPLAPARLVLFVGDVIREQVEREWYDPAVVRRRLTEVDEAAADGRIGAPEADRRRRELIGRIVHTRQER